MQFIVTGALGGLISFTERPRGRAGTQRNFSLRDGFSCFVANVRPWLQTGLLLTAGRAVGRGEPDPCGTQAAAPGLGVSPGSFTRESASQPSNRRTPTPQRPRPLIAVVPSWAKGFGCVNYKRTCSTLSPSGMRAKLFASPVLSPSVPLLIIQVSQFSEFYTHLSLPYRARDIEMPLILWHEAKNAEAATFTEREW